MRKILSLLLLIVFLFGLMADQSLAAKKKKKVRRYKRWRIVRRNWPKGERPVFPKDGQKSVFVLPNPPSSLTVEAGKAQSLNASNLHSSTSSRLSFIPKIGSSGGALAFGAEFLWPRNEDLNLRTEVQLGIGQGYYLINLKGKMLLPIKDRYFVGFGLDLVNYSEDVQNVFGVSGKIDKGLKVGMGISAGLNLDRYQLQAGYGSALGLVLSLGYQI